MRITFTPSKRKEYQIVRDYLVSNDHLQGIYFVLKDVESKMLFTRFLKKDFIHNEIHWVRKGWFSNRRFCMVVESGPENKVVHEKGVLKVEKTSDSVKRYEAEKITFFLKTDVDGNLE